MSNLEKAKPAVAIELGGRVRRIIFNLWAISVIEEEKGDKFLTKLKNLTLPKLLFLLWAGLLDDSPELDGATAEDRRAGQKQVMQWVNDSDLKISQISKAVFQAFDNCRLSGKDEPGEAKEKNEQSGQTPELIG